MLLSFFGIFFYKFNSFFINILNKKNKSIIEKNSDCIIFLNAQEVNYNLKIKKIINFHDLLHERFPNFFPIVILSKENIYIITQLSILT